MKNDEHITQDELVMVVVDQGSLMPAQQAHLRACPVCRSESERLARDLTGLGNMAKAVAPPMQTTIMLPEAKVAKPARPWGLRLAYGSALAAALVVLMLAVPFSRITPNGKLEVVYQDMLSDAELMLDIDSIQDNPMPQSWSALDDQDDEAQDEDFMDGIAPGGDDLS